MTTRRDLKRRVRDRQGRTGESYMTALRHVLAQRDEPAPERAPVPVVELIDISEAATAIGMQCGARLVPWLADRIHVGATLRRLVDVLLATTADPAFDKMRSVVLHGAQPMARPMDLPAIQRFLARVRAGIGGVSDHGQIVALTVDGRHGMEMVLFCLWLQPVAYLTYKPFVCLAAPDGMAKIGPYDLAWR